MRVLSNSSPYIIAYGASPKEIIKYYIAVEQHLMDVSIYTFLFYMAGFNYIYMLQVPSQFDFSQVLDLFYKVHTVFHTNYDPQLENMFYYIEHYIYGVEHSKEPSLKMIELYNYFFELEE